LGSAAGWRWSVARLAQFTAALALADAIALIQQPPYFGHWRVAIDGRVQRLPGFVRRLRQVARPSVRDPHPVGNSDRFAWKASPGAGGLHLGRRGSNGVNSLCHPKPLSVAL